MTRCKKKWIWQSGFNINDLRPPPRLCCRSCADCFRKNSPTTNYHFADESGGLFGNDPSPRESKCGQSHSGFRCHASSSVTELIDRWRHQKLNGSRQWVETSPSKKRLMRRNCCAKPKTP